MPDNTSIRDAANVTVPIASDDVSGVQFQKVKLDVGGDGVSVPVDGALPVSAVGELIEAIESMRMAVQALTRSVGQSMPDTAGRLRVAVDSFPATVPTLTTVTTVSTLSNQTLIGGFAATEQIPSLMRLGADSARRNINVT
jgi:hypothetical protein